MVQLGISIMYGLIRKKVVKSIGRYLNNIKKILFKSSNCFNHIFHSGKYKKKIGKAHQVQTECKLCGEFFMASREKEKNHVALSRHLYERHTLAEDNACDICGNK